LKSALLVGAAMLAACAAAPREAPMQPVASAGIPLRNAGFENAPRPGERCPEGWSCTMHADPDSFRFVLDPSVPAEGRRSLCIERVRNEPWAVASQSVPATALRGRRLRFSIALRGERMTGPGGGPWLLVNGPAGMLAHEERIALRGPAWERHSIEVTVPAQAIALVVGATLQGPGRVCIDDARLEPT
jgi:hypothetical protein